MTALRPCTEAEYEAFIASYPRTLRRTTDSAARPPVAVYSDVLINSVVAIGPAEEGDGWRIAEP